MSLDLIAKLRKTNNGFAPQGDLVCPSDQALRSVQHVFTSAPAQPKARSRFSSFLGRGRLLQSSQPADSMGATAKVVLGANIPAQRHATLERPESMLVSGEKQLRSDAGGTIAPWVLLDQRLGESPAWMRIAVSQPGSLEWWQALDNLGINGDDVLAAMDASASQAGGWTIFQLHHWRCQRQCTEMQSCNRTWV